jgi:hypothetical protein
MQLVSGYTHRCSEIKSYRYGLNDWATDKQLDLLCRRAAGVFIYATAKVLKLLVKNNNSCTTIHWEASQGERRRIEERLLKVLGVNWVLGTYRGVQRVLVLDKHAEKITITYRF